MRLRYILHRNPRLMQAGPLLRLVIPALALLVGLSACAPVPVEPEVAAQSPTLEEARSLERAGEPAAAAEAYLRAADEANPAQRAVLQLDAARVLLDADLPGRARSVLEQVDAARLNDTGRWELSVLSARLALSIGDAETALATLPEPGPDVPAPLYQRMLRTRAQAYALLGHHLEAARTRVALDPLLTEPEAQLENRRAIWTAVTQLTPAALEQLATEPPPDPLSGWLQLAAALKRAGLDQNALEQELALWNQRFPGHPAGGAFLSDLLSELQQTRRRPGTIALLLPADGPLAAPAAAIRDGFLAAYYRDTERDPDTRIRVYDSNVPEGEIWSLYRAALDDGADLIVGPLDKRHVATLAQAAQLEVPVLALNTVEDLAGMAPPQELYQFGLSPEDDARQIAERASLEGLVRAVALVPEGEWGTRVLNAFAARLQQLGGQVLEAQSYDPTESDFSGPIQRVLNLDQSEARHQSLRRVTRRDIRFEPSRRQDVDFVFVAAFPGQARLMAPQLRFHHAADLPVYATSHAFTGRADPSADQDMDGVMFCDIPWLLQPDTSDQALAQRLGELWPQEMASYPRLLALGVDVYRILPYLGWLSSRPYERWPGNTGLLHMDASGRIHRVLQWARFVNGDVVPVREALAPGSGEQRTGPGLDLLMDEERPDGEGEQGGPSAPAARP